MSIRNKIKVILYLEDGCKQEEDEVSTSWAPVNFDIYSSLFPELIQIAIDEWLSNHEIGALVLHEVIFAHVVEHDGAGAVTSEYFDPIYHETQLM